MANIKVAVRVRPISAREVNLTGSQVVVRANRNEISLTNLKVSSSKAGDSRERTRRYGFDYCFDSSDAEAESYADQAKIYRSLGQSVLDGIFSGYNSCLVAYGQTASGKTYTMMGTKEDPGLTPRLCEGLFARIEEEKRNERMYCVSVSYLEIYNERVRDLLKTAGGPSGLRVREHPRLGPYVQGLTRHVVHTLGSLMSYVEEGSKARKTASTLQNPSSSRSHALLTISLSEDTVNVAGAGVNVGQTSTGPTASSTARRNVATPRSASKLHLVDLAGSESAATCSGVHRLKEGANINKSLVALGNVISALAERGSTGSGPGRRFIPYRDSSLTWLLKDALGGNATTIMLATISPASGSYNETAHTLRFAHRAQSVVNRPVINEDPVAKIIRELRAEIARLKLLLLEKDAEVDGRTLCNCGTLRAEPETDSSGIEVAETVVRADEEGTGEDDRSIVRRSNSIEGIVTRETRGYKHLRRFGSYECLSTTGRLSANYRRARVTELKDEEDEINEINESVFVDIPTLVAVLIKPDDTLQEPGTQIEEICSDEVAEDSIDSEFIESANDHEIFHVTEKLGPGEQEDRSSPVNSCQVVDIDLQEVYGNSRESVLKLTEVGSKGTSKLRKQASIDIAPRSLSSNLHTSRKFGSVEIIQRRKDPIVTLERSQTNLEKRPVLPDRSKKLNNIREIDDLKGRNKGGSLSRGSGITGSKEHLQRKGSNDSDKSLKDSPSAKSKGHARKPSFENLKRKTSKDSSSSSSKDEQILISSSPRDKLLRRKSSFDQEGSGSVSPGRAHTPIQRTKRADIVAAVTERLYASRKHVEEGAASTSASGVRSPPEGTDVKVMSSVSSTRSKLQEISRRMLAKRRRVCVDTQTDILHTVRVKDTASLTELQHQDVAVLTDNHETCDFSDQRIPTLRVKEIATLTEKPKMTIVRCRDVGSLATDFQDFECDLHSLRNDSGILSDDTQNYAESNLSSTEVSDLCVESDRRILCTDSSTNTSFLSPYRNSAVQVSQLDVPRVEAVGSKAPICIRDCCKSVQEPRQRLQSSSVQTAPLETLAPQVPSVQMPNLQVPSIQVASPEKNVISISLPDMISITIESSNILESRVAVMDSVDHVEEKLKIITRDRESQTEEHGSASIDLGNRLCFKDLTRSTLSQTEGRVFRIENIFQDPKNVTRNCSRLEEPPSILDSGPVKNSFTLTNSLGTSYVTNGKDGDLERREEGNLYCELSKTSSFPRDGLITEAFITKKLNLAPHGCRGQFIHGPWESWSVYCPFQCVDYQTAGDAVSAPWHLENHQILTNDLTLTSKNNSIPSTAEDSSNLTNDSPLNPGPSSTGIETNTLDHEYNFSDDSLDYNVNSILKKELSLCEKHGGDSDSRENLCPPDVVAHTKKEVHKAINSSETDKENGENIESNESSDFEVEEYVVIPKARPNDLPDGQAVHDYKTLIFGEPFTNVHEARMEGVDTTSSEQKSGGKKRVSFSNSNTPEKGREADKRAAGKGAARPTTLKSIIKKKKVSQNEDEEQHCSDHKTDNSTQATSGSTIRENINNDSKKIPKMRKVAGDSQGSDECLWNLKEPRKRMRLPEEDILEDTCSESDSCSSLEEELLSGGGWSRSVVEEYLSEAAKFMRNMNSINEYMSATRSFGRCPAGSRRRESRRRASNTWDDDYRENHGRKTSSGVERDEHLWEEDNERSTDSYDKCLEGIRRLEECIQRVDRQTELLREKYGINCESAGARLSLASPGIDPSASAAGKKEATISNTEETMLHNISSVSRSLSAQIHPGNNNSESKEEENEEENLEKRIFDQLMSSVDSGECWSLRRSRPTRWSPPRTSDHASPTTDSTYRDNVDILGPGYDYNSHACDDSFGTMNTTFSSSKDYVDSTKVKPEDSATLKSQNILNELAITDDWLERNLSRRTLENNQEGRSSNSPKMSVLLKVDTSDIEDQGSTDTTERAFHFREKLRYPGSPRARFLELLRERRRIVESSRGSCLS